MRFHALPYSHRLRYIEYHFGLNIHKAVYDTTSVKFSAGKHIFSAGSSKIAFEGFRNVYIEADDVKDNGNSLLCNLQQGAHP